MKRLLGYILEMVYPHFCIICGCRHVGGYICAGCLGKVSFIKSHCVRCGTPFWGEAESRECSVCREEKFVFGSARCLFAYDGVGREWIHTLKYNRGHFLGGDMGLLLEKGPNFLEFFEGATLVPVPLSRRKERLRGFNQSELIAEVISKLTGAKVESLLLRKKGGETQTHLDKEARRRNVRGVFALQKKDVLCPKKRYVVIDDVFTTGATLNECAKVLKQSGASSVDVAALAHG